MAPTQAVRDDPSWGSPIVQVQAVRVLMFFVHWNNQLYMPVWIVILHLLILKKLDSESESYGILAYHEGNPLVTCGFPSQRVNNAKYAFISRSHHEGISFHQPLCRQNDHINGLVQECIISGVLAVEILQSCTKPLIRRTSTWRVKLWIN